MPILQMRSEAAPEWQSGRRTLTFQCSTREGRPEPLAETRLGVSHTLLLSRRGAVPFLLPFAVSPDGAVPLQRSREP